MAQTIFDVKAVVSSGIAFLDRHSARGTDVRLKDWRTRVHLDALDMTDGYACMLGQLFGRYQHGRNMLEIPDDVAAASLGFFQPTAAQSDYSHALDHLREIADAESIALRAEWIHQLQGA